MLRRRFVNIIAFENIACTAAVVEPGLGMERASMEQGVKAMDDAYRVFPPVFMRRKISWDRQQQYRMISARHWASNLTKGESTVAVSAQLYTLGNGMMAEKDGDVTLEAIPAVDALLELKAMFFESFSGLLKAGNQAEVVILRPHEEINSSLLLKEAFLEELRGC
ncbi:uncharacterized protein PHALS_04396 [Plasmopara halstedii]|uniref:Uncharacterized protein n=1 Tax=Plasmopara halstedii TaxID=4781 RepID=A0A0P1B1C5_PLAHL|nr:uncharacterized protein PHALS_04396 [Plasmopara halstedii]CEG47528.1 hypothetical protein PHALS_04396 [Plasmopara halstedii]|eukprot:XP_024583897.1 hypothetical protein PHALS_04396 [Plasmopara halstedii]